MDLTESLLRTKLARHQPRALPRSERSREASVAAIVRFVPAAEVLLIKRADHPQDRWSGHMAFPGGRHEPDDASLRHTAERETEEEVGIDLSRSASFLGRLDDVQAIARGRLVDLIIVPHVFLLQEAVELRLDRSEVNTAVWGPLDSMASGEIDTARPYTHEGRRFELPGFHVGEHVVWGLTYRMLESLIGLLKRA